MPGRGAGIIVASSFSSSRLSVGTAAIAATLAVGLDVLTLTGWLGGFKQTLEFATEYSSLLSECRLSEFVLLTLSRLVVFVIAVETLNNEPL